MQKRVRRVGDAHFESRDKTGLADPRLAWNQHDLACTCPSEPLTFQKEFEFVFAADEISQARRMDRLEAAPGRRHAVNCPSRNRLGNTLHSMEAKLAQTEKIAQQPARG